MGAERVGKPAPDIDPRDLMDGAALLASTANVIMQLAQPPVGYGVVESQAGNGVMRHPVRRIRTTVTYLSVAFGGTAEERGYYRRRVNRAHALVRPAADSPVRYSAFDPRLQLWVAACLRRVSMTRPPSTSATARTIAVDRKLPPLASCSHPPT